MNRITRTLTDAAARVWPRTAEVSAVTEHGPRFRAIALTGASLEGLGWDAGDKVQIRTGTKGFTLRTYTPTSWDPTRGRTTLLAYLHGTGPGSTWARSLAAGDACQLYGPHRSLRLDDAATPIVFIGDETSFAVVAAYRNRHPGVAPVAELFEVSDPDAAAHGLRAVGLTTARTFVRDDPSTPPPDLASTLVAVLEDHDDTTVCLTGRAQTIAALRRRLKDAGLADRPTRVKAYWDENRTGLD